VVPANDDAVEAVAAIVAEVEGPPVAGDAAAEDVAEGGEAGSGSEDDPRNRRRGRRGGRRRRRDGEGEVSPFAVPGAEQPELPPVYAGPTPADPFGGRAFDIFDVMDQVERAAEARPLGRAPAASEIVNNTAPEAEAVFAEPGVGAEPEQAAAEGEPEAAGPEEAVPGEAVPEEAVPGEAVSGEAVSGEAVLDIVNAAAPEPGSVALPPDEADVTEEPPPPEPAVRPILVGADGEGPLEKKRGWWRR
jgi:ribonuclease E